MNERGAHRSSVRPLATTQRNQKACETGLTLSPPQAAVAGSRMPEKPCGRNTIIIRDDVIESVRALKAESGANILTDGSSQLVHALLTLDVVDEVRLLVYPLIMTRRSVDC